MLNKYKWKYLLPLLVWVAGACNPSPTVWQGALAYTDFPHTVALKGETVKLDTALFRYAFRIQIAGNRALVMDMHGEDHFVHLFTFPKFNYLSSICRKGNAPGEALSIENIRYNGETVWTLDPNKKEITRFIHKGQKDSLLACNRIILEEGVLRALDFVLYNDTSFIIPDYSGRWRFCVVNQHGKCIGKFGDIPTINEEAKVKSPIALSQAWRSFIDYNSYNGVLAAVTQLGEVLEIYHPSDTTYHKVSIGLNGEPHFDVLDGNGIPTGILGFGSVQVTDSLIYATFNGTTFRSIARANGELPDGCSSIFVFDLDGNPVCRYMLDRYIYGMQIDEKNQTIWATDVNNDEPIVKFSM